MKTKIRAFYIITASLLLMTIACVLMTVVPEKNEKKDSGSQIVYQVTDYSVAEAGAVAVTNRNGTFGLMCYTDGTIELIDDKGNGSTAFSQTELRSLVYAICHISSVRKITDFENLDDYGYADPSSTIVLFLNSGETVSLMLLRQSQMDGNYYLYRQDTNELFLLDEANASLFLRSSADFAEHGIFPEVSASELSSIESISYRSAEGESWTITGKNGGFALSDPIRQKLRTSVVYSKLVAPLASLYGDTCLAASDALEEYGFGESDEMYAMTVGGKEYAAAFKRTDSGLLMANLKTGSVYSLSDDELTDLAGSVLELMDGKAYYYSLGDCRALTISDGENDVSFDISRTENETSVRCREKELTSEEVIELSKVLNGVSIAARTNEVPDSSPVLEIVLTLESGSMERIRFLPVDSNYTAVSVNGTVNFSAPEADVAKIKELLTLYSA